MSPDLAAFPEERAAIIGLGLIGGSIARDLEALGFQLAGYDADPAALDAAVNEDVITERLTAGLEGAGDYPVIVIATPVRSAFLDLRRLAPHGGKVRLVTDVGSVKRPIVAEATTLEMTSFVGSHPLAGDHKSGWMASRRGLFQDARVFLCRTPVTSEASVQAACQFWGLFGATTVDIDAEAHDQLMSRTSHLPQIFSSGLGLVLAENGTNRSALGPGGRDMTRLAGSDPSMWTDIALSNADHLGADLERLGRVIEDFRRKVVAQDEAAIRDFFERARTWFNQVPPSDKR